MQKAPKRTLVLRQRERARERQLNRDTAIRPSTEVRKRIRALCECTPACDDLIEAGATQIATQHHPAKFQRHRSNVTLSLMRLQREKRPNVRNMEAKLQRRSISTT